MRLEVPAGWWRLAPTTDGSGRVTGYTAELALVTSGRDVSIVWSTQASKLWRLEAALGWAIPIPVQQLLIRAPRRAQTPSATRQLGARQGETAPRVDDVTITSLLYRRWRASSVHIGDAPVTTYGRLLADEPIKGTWRYGDMRVDLIGDLTTGDESAELTAWRIHDGDPVVFAGNNTPGLIETTTDTTATMRDVLGIPAWLRRASMGLTNRQRHFVDRYADLLDHFAALPDRPYPPGTRVRVVLPDGQEADGTVLAAARRADGGTTYRWRPDVADLPGHPWQYHPT